MSMLVVGGSGFIGTHVCERFGAKSYDLADGNDAHDLGRLTAAMLGCRTVVHLASNADIAASATEPTLDFTEGTVLTSNVCEAARLAGVERIVYASGSGVYGERGFWHHEHSPLDPVSPYGASKVAGEALVGAYCRMFGMRGVALRFANVVGPGQTHGVAFDFVRKLRWHQDELVIMGDGHQEKSYLAVTDAIAAIEKVLEPSGAAFEAFNVSSNDTLTVREIANMTCARLNVTPTYFFTGGECGWPGDVPRCRMTTIKLRRKGWAASMCSREAMSWALESMA